MPLQRGEELPHFQHEFWNSIKQMDRKAEIEEPREEMDNKMMWNKNWKN